MSRLKEEGRLRRLQEPVTINVARNDKPFIESIVNNYSF